MLTYVKQEQKSMSKEVVQKKNIVSPTNLTGIPNNMKMKFENYSGFSFDDVRVHYNSDKPVQLQAFAYAQGNQVYIAPGQEKHLGHELGHVVQQKQGKVMPTAKKHGIAVNDSPVLEAEADRIAKLPSGITQAKRVAYTDSNVYQLSRAKAIHKGNGKALVIKVNFAGSGFAAWQKAGNIKGLSEDEFVKGVKKGARKRARYKYKKMYGEKVDPEEKIRKKIEGNTITFTFPGPMKGGIVDRGTYNIKENVKKAFNLVKNNIDDKPDDKVKHVVIKGHSRGGVAAGMLYYQLKSNYKDNTNVHFHLTQFDPVPGPGHIGKYNKIDYNKFTREKIRDDRKVVVYALRDQYGPIDHVIGSFTPQMVLGANVVILTPDNHSVGLDKTKEGHKRGFGSRKLGDLESMADGVYYYNSKDLVKINSVNAFLEETKKSGLKTTGQKYMEYFLHGGRLEVITSVLSALFPGDPDAGKMAPSWLKTLWGVGSRLMTGGEALLSLPFDIMSSVINKGKGLSSEKYKDKK